MRKLYAISAAFALAAASVVRAQPPAQAEPVPKAPPAKANPPKKPADPTDAAIAAALANDADMQMARAKLQLAEAELAKAKQAATLRVLTLKAQIEGLKAERDTTLERVRLAEARVRAGQEPQATLAETRIAYEKVNRALATAEAEWKLLTGGAGSDAAQKVTRLFDEFTDSVLTERDHDARVRLMAQLLAQARAAKAPVGPVSERIRAALDKPVSLDAKDKVLTVPQAVDALKRAAGLDVSVRGLDPYHSAQVQIQGEEMSAVAWFQLLQDQIGCTAYVREYGILFANKENAPTDAITLTEFWKQKPAPAPKK